MTEKNIQEDKKTVLLMPVGTGFGGTQESADNLAFGLLFLIKQEKPDNIVFFASELSKKTTLKSLKQQYKEETGEEINKISRFITIKDIDDFQEFYKKISNQINDYKNYNIKIDYTSGTKTMTMAASIAASENNLELIFVSGKRGNKNIVEKGTEFIRRQNLSKVHFDKTINDVQECFNHYRFKEGIDLLDNLADTGVDGLEFIKKVNALLLATYNYWDNFNHQVANVAFSNGFIKKLSDNQVKANHKALNIICDENNPLNQKYALASMINNAIRRSEEGKYDDAIARLYRCMELISEIILKEYDINPRDVDVNKVKEISENAHKNIMGKLIRGHNSQLRMPGVDSNFMLIHELNGFNKVGQYYYDNRDKFINALQLRNNSILAHGLEMMDEDDYNEFEELILNLAELIDENMDKYIEETRFPKWE